MLLEQKINYRNMKINVDNTREIQKKINAAWAANARSQRKCNITAQIILSSCVKITKLMTKMNRKISDYDGSIIEYNELQHSKTSRGIVCLNFKLLIEKGKFYLIKLFKGITDGKLKEMTIILPKLKYKKQKFFGEKWGNCFYLAGDVISCKFYKQDIDFDYKITDIEDTKRMITAFNSNLQASSIKLIQDELQVHYKNVVVPMQRGKKIRYYLSA
jgi:hypothetical protein